MGHTDTHIYTVQQIGVIMEEGRGEKVTFLGNRINKDPHTRVVKNKRCCFGWSKKKICCCCCTSLVFLIAAGVTIIYLLLFVFKHGDKSADAAKWEAELIGGKMAAESSEVSMDGTFTLQSYDDQYEGYLKALGIPWYVVPLILASSETLRVTVTEDRANVTTETAWATREMIFSEKGIVNERTFVLETGNIVAKKYYKREEEDDMESIPISPSP